MGRGRLHTPSLRAQRSNPDCRCGRILDCFAAPAMTMGMEPFANPDRRPGVCCCARDCRVGKGA
ncbi:hypothetical protein FXV83_19865 [Bradyrhizobium hipponense]|uniref:Uncharacterized protein n=1 Tax=Bradyrhizobium hipponense TaxID=2605638 RepID=A0A5S4YKB5_9BRAD|nr:hypothetical protein FXV83_19865 [Bradyrhizobium hipponense]